MRYSLRSSGRALVSTKRLFCVDDDPQTLMQRKMLLEANGYSVATATSGQEALAVLERQIPPDLLMLDFVMPGMNGDELARELRERYPELPLVAVTGADPLPTGFRELVDGCVRKGEEPQVLLAEVASVLRNREQSNGKGHEAQKTALCVEDEDLQLTARRMVLESGGYRVFTARTVREAMEAFESNDVDVVVMDYWLSDQDGNGTALAERMKRLRPTTPIVMLSGFTALPGEGALLDSWMQKSQMDPEKLLAEVDRVIQLRNLRQQTDDSR